MKLTQTEQENLEWFKNFTEICEKYKIWYSVMYGTLIGAIRHKGKIPWDDDYDVIMTPEGYTKLKKLYPNNCLDRDYSKSYPFIFPKFVPSVKDTKKPVFVDLFLIVPSNRKKFKKLTSLTNTLKDGIVYLNYRKTNLSLKVKIFKLFAWPLKFFIHQLTPKKCINIIKANRDIEFFYIIDYLSKFKDQNFKIIKNISFQTKLVKFENFKVQVIIEYDIVLRNQYGDYMIPKKYIVNHINVFERV